MGHFGKKLCARNSIISNVWLLLAESIYDAVPKSLFWLVGPYVGISRQFISNNIDIPIKFDNTKSKTELGIEYHSLEETLQDMFQVLVDNEAVKKA